MQECEVCATHVTSNMHPAAACRDSCDNPILVKSSWTSYWLPLGSLNTCVNNGAFAMQALAGCNLLLKCCGTSSVKWRVLLTSAVLGLSSSEVLFFLASLSLWISLEFLRYCSSLTFWDYYNYSSSKISGQIFFDNSGPSYAATPLSGAQGEETEASKWAMSLPPSRVFND